MEAAATAAQAAELKVREINTNVVLTKVDKVSEKKSGKHRVWVRKIGQSPRGNKVFGLRLDTCKSGGKTFEKNSFFIYKKNSSSGTAKASSLAAPLSFYDLIIYGLEYRQEGFLFLFLEVKASLPLYIIFIRYFHTPSSVSSYYPGPSFFPNPLQQH